MLRLPLLSAALGLLALAACADRQSGRVTPQDMPRPNSPMGASASSSGPSVNWRASLAGNMAVIEVRDRNNVYRVDRVELLSPDGRSFAANDITREKMSPGGRWTDSGSGIGVGVGGSGGSSGGANVGVMFDIPLGRGGRADPIDTEARTTARIPLPAGYLANAAQWKARISFTDYAGDSSVAVIPAPLPE